MWHPGEYQKDQLLRINIEYITMWVGWGKNLYMLEWFTGRKLFIPRRHFRPETNDLHR